MMKGQGLSITTIVVAAIALLILVVLVAVFTGQFGSFATGVRSCHDVPDADCFPEDNPPDSEGWNALPGKNCPTEGDKCYVRVGEVRAVGDENLNDQGRRLR